MWINVENFARMKRDGLLGAPFVVDLPSSSAINLAEPTIAADFSVPTDGLEAPWGRAQLVFCLLYTSPSPRDRQKSRMPSSA